MNKKYRLKALRDFSMVKEELLSTRRIRYGETKSYELCYTQNSWHHVYVLVSPGSFNFFKRQTSEREEIYENIMIFCILPVVIFLIIFWLIPGARVRYILPLSGLLALAISGAIGSSMETDRAKKFALIIAIVVILSGLTIPFIKDRFEFSSMIPYICGVLLFGGGIYLLSF